ncbi:MAG TPA: tetratricopeptide repeat protein [Pirellulales bacterium]|nr:tetratricopeptide repeat protein [Pirellulales bacterium]
MNIAPRQVAADRYSYLASIGFIALGAGLVFRWSCGDLRWRPFRVPGRGARQTFGFAGLAAIGVLCVLSWRQSATWHDSEMLWAHAAEHGQATSVVVQTNLGLAYADIGRLDDSLDCFKLALDLLPHAPTSLQNYARALAKLGFNREAIPHFREAIRLKPDFVTVRNNLALTLLRLGDTQGAEDELNLVLKIAPDYADAHNNLGLVLLRTGRNSEAVPHFTKALRLQPGNIAAEKNLHLARDAGEGAPGKREGGAGDRQSIP